MDQGLKIHSQRGSATYGKKGKKDLLNSPSVPTRKSSFNSWKRMISKYRIKGAGDNFTKSNRAAVVRISFLKLSKYVRF